MERAGGECKQFLNELTVIAPSTGQLLNERGPHSNRAAERIGNEETIRVRAITEILKFEWQLDP
jgi:hypothetical protein